MPLCSSLGSGYKLLWLPSGRNWFTSLQHWPMIQLSHIAPPWWRRKVLGWDDKKHRAVRFCLVLIPPLFLWQLLACFSPQISGISAKSKGRKEGKEGIKEGGRERGREGGRFQLKMKTWKPFPNLFPELMKGLGATFSNWRYVQAQQTLDQDPPDLYERARRQQSRVKKL